MNKRFLFASSALWALAMAMIMADPVFAQRGGGGGRGGGGKGGGSGRQSSGNDGARAGGNKGGGRSSATRNDNVRRGSDQVRTVPRSSSQDVQRSYQRDTSRWTDSNRNWDSNRDWDRDRDRDRGSNWYRDSNRYWDPNRYLDNNQNRNQWSNRYPTPWTGRSYPSYGNYRPYSNYNYGYGGWYGNNFGSPYYGNYYGNRLGYGSGISNLIGLAAGLSGYGGFGVPGIGLGYGGYGAYGAYGPYGYNSLYSSRYSRPYVVENYTIRPADTYVSTPNSVGEFLESGKASFLAGDYANAQRQANHAVVEAPENPKAHELMMLSMFAQGDFAGAAAAAHAVADLGQVPDWPTLYGYYKNRDRYVQHLEKLQQHVKENPDQPDGRFLLGFNYHMIGDKNHAKQQFARYVELVRAEDQIAVKLFKDLGGDVSTLPQPESEVPVTAPDNSASPTLNDRLK